MVLPGEYLSFLSIDKWTIIFNLINTFILYKIIKKFLFKPVNDMINDRKIEIEKNYSEVEKMLTEANDLKNNYEVKMKNSNKEAMKIIDNAKIMASHQVEKMLKNAKDESDNLMLRTNQEIKLQSEKAINNIKEDVVDMAMLAASKIIKKEISKNEHKKIIDELFNEVKV